MPGMMDTVLNLGLNDETVEGLAAKSSDARFAYDSYRRFIQMYGDVVLGVDHYLFEDELDAHQARNSGLSTWTPNFPPRTRRTLIDATRPWSRKTSGNDRFRRTPRPSSGVRSAPSSAPG